MSCHGANGFTYTDNGDTGDLDFDGSAAAGTYTCTITADDTFTNGADSSKAFDVVVNTRPVQTDPADQALLEGEDLNFSIAGSCTDADTDPVTITATDSG